LRVQGFISFIGAAILPPVFSARMGISEASYLPLFFVVGQFWGFGGLFKFRLIADVILIARSFFLSYVDFCFYGLFFLDISFL